MAKISEELVPLAAEDRFLIVSIRKALSLCPGAADAAALGETIDVARPFLGDLIPLFDLRGLPHIYNDVDVFMDEVSGRGAHVLVNPRTAEQIDIDYYVKARGLQVLSVKGHRCKAKPFELTDIRTDITDQFGELSMGLVDEFTFHDPENISEFDEGEYQPPSLEALERVLTPTKLRQLMGRHFPAKLQNGIRFADFAQSLRAFLPKIQESLSEIDPDGRFPLATDFYVRSALLHSFLRQLHRNSLLVEFVMSTDGESITCTPYHGSAIHEVERPNASDVLVGRPAVVADKTRALFSSEIEQFQNLLNDPGTRERHLQKFLEQHKHFLSGLNYTSIYPQLILQRDDGTQLRPDFFLEPHDDVWCDILDIKLPTQSILVGRRDRATLAAGIHEVAAQLREYAAYFEEEKHRKFVKEKYGLRVYKPRLIAIVGRDIRQMTDPQIRRAMTAYENIEVMTFDDLVRHAKSRLLL